MPGYVYVSYSRADSGYVTALVAYLAEQGVTAWADPEAESEQRWAETGRAQLDGADSVVVVMSPASGTSPVVGQAVAYAGQIGKPVAPLLLGGHVFPSFAALPGENVSDGRMPTPAFVAALRQPMPAPVSAVPMSGVPMSGMPMSGVPVSAFPGSALAMTPPPPPVRKSRTGLWVGLAGALALVLLVAGGVTFVALRGKPVDQTEPVATATHAPPPEGKLQIAVDLPFKRWDGEDIFRALEFYLNSVGNKAGGHEVMLKHYDNSLSVSTNQTLCQENVAQHRNVSNEVAIIGTGLEACTRDELAWPKSGEPLLMVSPADTYPGFTKAWGQDEPGMYQPGGVRSFARVVASGDVHGTAAARFVGESLHARKCFVFHGNGLNSNQLAERFVAEAAEQGITIVGRAEVGPGINDFTPYFEQATSGGAECVYVAGPFGLDQLLRDKQKSLPATIPLLLSTEFGNRANYPAMVGAEGVYTLQSGLPVWKLTERSPVAAKFLADFEASVGHEPANAFDVVYAVQALQLVLAAIEASDGSRYGILSQVFGDRPLMLPASTAIVGKRIGIDPATGDCTTADVAVVVIHDKVRYLETTISV